MRIRNIYLGFKLSVSYFSTIPTKFSKDDDLKNREVLSFMLFFFPLVGAIIALLAFKLYALMDIVGWYGAFIASVSYILFYGFLHIEAVIDTRSMLFILYTLVKTPIKL